MHPHSPGHGTGRTRSTGTLRLPTHGVLLTELWGNPGQLPGFSSHIPGIHLESSYLTFPALEHFSERCACISLASFCCHHLSEAILITLFKTEIQVPSPFPIPFPLLFLYRPYHHLTYYTVFIHFFIVCLPMLEF